MEPGSAAPGIRNGCGRLGRAVPRSLVQLTAAAAFKFCSSCGGRKQEAPKLLARASRAHPCPRTRLPRQTLGMVRSPHPAEIGSIPTPRSWQGGCWRCLVSCYWSFFILFVLKSILTFQLARPPGSITLRKWDKPHRSIETARRFRTPPGFSVFHPKSSIWIFGSLSN